MASGGSLPQGRASESQTNSIAPNPKDKELDSNQRPSTSTSPSEQDVAGINGQEPSLTNEEAEHAPNGVTEEKPARSKLKVALIMFALGLAVFLAAIDITIITTALPTISEHFHSSAGYTWIGSSYLLASAASTPIWGKISDIWGRKPILLIANVVFFVGSLIAGLSINIGMLITARAIQGIGGGGLIVLVNICISDLFSMRERGAYFGIIGGVWAIASSLGPIVGGAFTEKVSWRWCFYINLPIDGVALIIIFLILDLHTPRTPLWEGLKAIDWLGSLSMVGGTLMFLFGLEFGGVSYPWSSATVICLLIFGVFTVALFFLIQARIAPYPIMPLPIFSARSNMAALGVCFFHAFVFISGSYYLPLYFQAVLGATPLLSGVYLLPTALSLSFSSIFTGIFIKKTGKYLPPIWTGFFFMTLGFGLFIDLAPGSSWAKIIIYQIIAGIGVGPNFQAPLIALQSLVAPRDIATATATFGFVRSLGTAISVVIGNVVFQNEMKKRSGMLSKALNPGIAKALSGGQAGANVAIINALPRPQREVAREAFADSLSIMWIMYVVFAAVGLLVAFMISKNVLSRQHVETKTGMEGEMERRRERENEKVRKREKKADNVEEKARKKESKNELRSAAGTPQQKEEV
ncbi:MFS multidrug transporter-like protein [Lophium mytilinum]|uniref:Efflux pump dotC n=1 Tax=Lophium mytilinum TaxID=390894 RepID=A0A6A6R3C8_9PEZI|nr:MFS multidrug transporter-like protein [Lophium mytilinum]